MGEYFFKKVFKKKEMAKAIPMITRILY